MLITYQKEIIVDISEMNLGNSLHVKSINLGTGVEPTHPERDVTIATIVAPSGLKSESSNSSEEE